VHPPLSDDEIKDLQAIQGEMAEQTVISDIMPPEPAPDDTVVPEGDPISEEEVDQLDSGSGAGTGDNITEEATSTDEPDATPTATPETDDLATPEAGSTEISGDSTPIPPPEPTPTADATEQPTGDIPRVDASTGSPTPMLITEASATPDAGAESAPALITDTSTPNFLTLTPTS
jgi:hypothetical protein